VIVSETRNQKAVMDAILTIQAEIRRRKLSIVNVRMGFFLARDINHYSGVKPNSGQYMPISTLISGNARVDGLDDRLRVFCIGADSKRIGVFTYLPHEATERQITWKLP